MNITLDDGRTELWQWDTGRKIVVDDKSVSEVHYSKYSSTQAITREVVDGKAEIPNFLLQDTHAVTVYAYSGSMENGYTMAEKTFNIAKKPKPANYVQTEEDQAILAKLKAAIGDLYELQTEAKDNLVSAINEAATSNRADWQQNNPTAKDYVKNRPGGYDIVTPEKIISEHKLTGYTVDVPIELSEPLVVGQSYRFTLYETADQSSTIFDGEVVAEVTTLGSHGDGITVTMSGYGDIFQPAAYPEKPALYQGNKNYAYGYLKLVALANTETVKIPNKYIINSDFIITGTLESPETVTLDKTFDQIQEAIRDGKRAVVHVLAFDPESENEFSSLWLLVNNSEMIIFSGTATDGGSDSVATMTLAINKENKVSLFRSIVPTIARDGTIKQLKMSAAPTEDMHIATKKYVDDNIPDSAVLYTQQTLTDAQKKQARENIDAITSDEAVKANYLANDMTDPSYIKNRLFYHKPEMVIAEIPPSANDYIVYACIDTLDNKSLTFTVKEKDTSTILETGFTFDANTNGIYRGNNFSIRPTDPFGNERNDEFGRRKLRFSNHTDKVLIFMSDPYYAKIPNLYLPKAGWNGKTFVPGLMTADQYSPTNINRYSSLLVDENGHLYNRERIKILKSFTFKYSETGVSSFTDETQILIAMSKGNMSQYFEGIDDLASYPVIIIPDTVYTFYFADGQIYQGEPRFRSSLPDEEPDSIVGLTKTASYYSAASDWTEIKQLSNNVTYTPIGLVAGQEYKVSFSQTGSMHSVVLEAAENESLGMVAIVDPGGRWTVGDTKTVVNSSWISNGLGSLHSLYKESIKKVIPIDAIIDADKLGASSFAINATIDSDRTVTLDKTYSDIIAAISSGKNTYIIMQSQRFNFLQQVSTKYYFSSLFSSASGSGTLHYAEIVIDNDASVVLTVFDDIVTESYINDKITDKELFLTSSTPGSTKKFKITVDDAGTLSAVEVTES